MFWGFPVSAGHVGQGVQGRLGAPAAFEGLGQDVLGGLPISVGISEYDGPGTLGTLAAGSPDVLGVGLPPQGAWEVLFTRASLQAESTRAIWRCLLNKCEQLEMPRILNFRILFTQTMREIRGDWRFPGPQLPRVCLRTWAEWEASCLGEGSPEGGAVPRCV